MIFYRPEQRDRALLPHDPMKALIAPRPIGWISTISAGGAVNLAPYSFFNAFSSSPCIIGFSSEGEKDSIAFLREVPEFVWNLSTFDLRDQMNATSASLPRGESEFAHAGLTPAASTLVRPPRIAEAPAAFECKLLDIIALKDIEGRLIDRYLALGQVVGVHLDERFIREGRVDTAALKPLARCGYHDYAVADETFTLVRPA